MIDSLTHVIQSNDDGHQHAFNATLSTIECLYAASTQNKVRGASAQPADAADESGRGKN
jgi:hypothetical protein